MSGSNMKNPKVSRFDIQNALALTPKGLKPPSRLTNIFSNKSGAGFTPLGPNNPFRLPADSSYTRQQAHGNPAAKMKTDSSRDRSSDSNNFSNINRPTSSKNSQHRLDSSSSSKQYFSSKDSSHLDSRNIRKPVSQLSSHSKVDSPGKRPLRINQFSGSGTTVLAPRPKSRSPQRVEEEITREQIYITPKKFTITSREIRHSNNSRPTIPKTAAVLPNYEPAKHSVKPNGMIRCYAACTNQGPVRQYNQDRVAIILNITKPEHCTEWKKAAYFGVFDGHGGTDCADYLRDTLHTFLTKQKTFPANIPQALSTSFYKCETSFLEKSKNMSTVDKSGSCATVVFIYGDSCFVANVGDSRVIMSSKNGDRISELSIDHKPSDEYEQKRIIENGGRIYQTKLQNVNPNLKITYDGEKVPFVLGPHRVFPGRLSVTRTFGDIEAKLPQFGGNPKTIIATPEIRSFKLTAENDFIILACDGIFDKLSNAEVIQAVWETARERSKYKNVHEFCGLAVENIMKLSVHKKTLDNITVVMLGFENLERILFPDRSQATMQRGSDPLKLDDSSPRVTRFSTTQGYTPYNEEQNQGLSEPAQSAGIPAGRIQSSVSQIQNERSSSRGKVGSIFDSRKIQTSLSSGVQQETGMNGSQSFKQRKKDATRPNYSPSGYRSFSYYRT